MIDLVLFIVVILRTSIVMAKPIVIATIIAATPAAIYISVGDEAVTGLKWWG